MLKTTRWHPRWLPNPIECQDDCHMKLTLYCDWLNEGIYLSVVVYCYKYKMAYKMAASVEQKITYSIKIARKTFNMVKVK